MANVEPVALLLCDRAEVGADGKVSLLGLCDVLWAQSFPAVHPRLDVFWRCLLDGPDALTVVVEGPDGQELRRDVVSVAGAGAAQSIHRLTDLDLPLPGRYRVRLETANGPLVTTWFDASSRH
jgi:hypothetical protein